VNDFRKEGETRGPITKDTASKVDCQLKRGRVRIGPGIVLMAKNNLRGSGVVFKKLRSLVFKGSVQGNYPVVAIG